MPRTVKAWYRMDRDQYYLTVGTKQIPLGIRGPKTPEKDAAAEEAARAYLAAPGSAVALGEAVAQFLARAAHRVGPNTLHGYEWFLGVLVDSFGGSVPLAGLTAASVERSAAYRKGWSRSTRNGYLGAVGTFLRDAGHPLKLRRPGKESRGAGAVWTEAEFWQVSGAALGDFKPLLRVLKDTGARPSEVSGLTVEGVDWDECLAVLRTHKNADRGKPRVVHFPASAVAELRRQRDRYERGHLFRQEDDRPFNMHSLCQRMIHARDRAGVGRPVSLYGLRHTFITRALEAGASAEQVAALVGNSPQMVHFNYSHVGSNARLMKEIAERATRPAA